MGQAPIPVQLWEELAKAARYRAHVLAGLRDITTRQLRRQFQRNFKRPPQDWLNERRIAAAEQLLLAGWLVKAVAFELGFKQVSHFCRVFKEFKRMTPSEFVRTQIHSNHQCPEKITNVLRR